MCNNITIKIVLKWRGKMRMDNVYIEIPRDLTSYEFYNTILPQREKIQISGLQEIILDFSETYRVEPLVIPNLLGLGYEIKRKYRKNAQIYIPEISRAGKLKNYLNQIGFVNYTQKYGLYEFISSPYGGLEGKKIDPMCGTLYFDVNNSLDDICREVKYYISPFSERYLHNFESMRENDQGIYYSNEITDFLEEIIINSKIHAESFSFTTLHAKYSLGKIYIATSDFGCGFYNTIGRSKNCKDDIESIFAGIYKRKNNKVYGLYNVIKRVLEYGGKFRIHSNKSQIIFTPRVLEEYIHERLLFHESFRKYNIKSNIMFDGVHVEIELPLERGK